MMQRYYDAHLYLANWGTHRIMLCVSSRMFPDRTPRKVTDRHPSKLHRTSSS